MRWFTLGEPGRARRRTVQLRRAISPWLTVLLWLSSIGIVYVLWWFVTRGEAEQRIINAAALPSPAETFRKLHGLWFERELTRNTVITLRRVVLGFSLACLVGIPVGILAGCFASVRALFAPLAIFGRNIPLAALIPLSFFFFGIGEWQKVMFIFVACVAFIITDVSVAIAEVSSRYLDTAYTLGAGGWQSMTKVLIPLAMPAIFQSARLLFGLAFGYIMLAELVRFGDEAGGLGNLINVSQRQGPREDIYLIVLLIPLVALAIDQLLHLVQRQLFPYRYGGQGYLHRLVRWLLQLGDSAKCLIRRPTPPYDRLTSTNTKIET